MIEIFLFCILAAVIGYEAGHFRGTRQGYRAGYSEGRADGGRAGYLQGRSEERSVIACDREAEATFPPVYERASDGALIPILPTDQ